MANPWIVGGALVGLGALAWSAFRGKTASAADIKAAAIKKAIEVGCADGTADGKADGGKAKNPRGVLNHSEIPDIQAQYDKSYLECYAKAWIPPKTDEIKLDTSKPGGGTKSTTDDAAAKTAASAWWMDGCSRGFKNGWADNFNGYAMSASPSKTRGDKYNAFYREAYSRSYNAGWLAANLTPYKDEKPSTSVESSAISSCNAGFSEFWRATPVAGFASVGALGRHPSRGAHRTIGQLFPRTSGTRAEESEPSSVAGS